MAVRLLLAERRAQFQAAREAGLVTELGPGGGMELFDEGGCSGLTLTATLLTNQDMRIDISCKEPGAKYDLLYATNITASLTWHWLQEIAPAMDLNFQDGGDKEFSLGFIQVFAESR